MIHTTRQIAAWLALGAAALALSAAAPPAGDAPLFRGRVLGPGGRPLGAVRVRIYVDGLAGPSVWADSAGAYSIALPELNGRSDVLAWFLPADDELVPECAFLGGGPLASSRAMPCVPRLSPDPSGGIEYSLTLLDTDARLERLRRSPCFEHNIHLPEQEITP